MASHIQGYDEERFASPVSRNFICSICLNVLKDPVMCPRNHHCFCRGCMTKHLENYQRCPTCADVLTVDTLTEPQRMVKDILNELNIRCVYVDRGCEETVQLQNLDEHEATCGFTPTVCTNQGCGATLNQRDLIHHESEVCEFRKLKCHSCREIKETLVNVGKRIANVEKNMASNMANVVTMRTDMKDIQTSMATNATNFETRVANMERNMEKNAADIEGKFEAVTNDVRVLKTSLIEAFNEMKDVLFKMDDKIEVSSRKVRNTPSGDRGSIIVAGSWGTSSVEMFNWRQRTWSPLHSMPKQRWGATSFVSNNHVTVAGGYSPGNVVNDDMIRMNIHPNPDPTMHWSNCPVKLPTKLGQHSSVLYNENLIVSGGNNGDAVSDCIHEVQLVPPYTVKTLSRMPEPRKFHSMQIFDDSLLIVGGRPTNRYQDNLSSVVLYDTNKNTWKQLAPLPYKVSKMATVRWGDNIVLIGGADNKRDTLDTALIYNVKTEQHYFLPPMKHKRRDCKAVVFGNNIVVVGGNDERWRAMMAVEVFNFESYNWHELPDMSEARYWHTAVVV